MFAVNGILFNHESPRRGETFVTRKITRAAARIKAGLQDELYLGNLDAVRDWGYAPEYVEAMWRMLQHDEPDDYVRGDRHGLHGRATSSSSPSSTSGSTGRSYVRFDERYLRPTEVDALIGDAAKASASSAGSRRCTRPELAQIMVDADVAALEAGGTHRVDVPDWRSTTAPIASRAS